MAHLPTLLHSRPKLREIPAGFNGTEPLNTWLGLPQAFSCMETVNSSSLHTYPSRGYFTISSVGGFGSGGGVHVSLANREGLEQSEDPRSRA